MLLGGDGGPPMVAQFCALTPMCFNKENVGGREDDEFKAMLEQMAGAVGRDISALPGASPATLRR